MRQPWPQAAFFNPSESTCVRLQKAVTRLRGRNLGCLPACLAPLTLESLGQAARQDEGESVRLPGPRQQQAVDSDERQQHQR